MKNEDELRERLSELEHQQWTKWSQDIARDLKDFLVVLEGMKLTAYPIYEKLKSRLQRWETYWKPYNELDYGTQEEDREWADKAILIMKKR